MADDLEAYLKDEPILARSGRFGQVLSQMFRETHHSVVLENWGLLWMWHSLALFSACALTNALQWMQVDRWIYMALWTMGIWIWAGVFWWLRRRMGPVTFVERQIAHVWASSMVAIAGLFFVEMWLGLPALRLSPVLPLIAGMVFVIKAGILSGTFYLQAVALFATSPLMARYPEVGPSDFWDGLGRVLLRSGAEVLSSAHRFRGEVRSLPEVTVVRKLCRPSGSLRGGLVYLPDVFALRCRVAGRVLPRNS